MTIKTPPSYLTAGTYTAQLDRYLIQDEAGTAGVPRSAELKVTQSGTPGMSVVVAAGGGFVAAGEGQGGFYFGYNDAPVTLSIAAADPTNPRIDLVIMTVRDAAASGTSNDVRLLVVQGTAAASPVAPSLTSYPNTITLAQIAVAAGATSITNANITDKRTKAMIPDASVSALTAVASPVEGQLAYNLTDHRLYVYDNTSTWQLVWPITAGAITGSMIASNTITSGNIQDGTITGTDIASATISGGNIAASTISPTNMASGNYAINISGTAATATTASSANTATTANSALQLTNGAHQLYFNGVDTWIIGPGDNAQVYSLSGTNYASFINGYYDVSPITGSASTQYYVWRSSDGKLVTRSGTSLRDHKENIADVEDALNKVLGLRPRTFVFKSEYVDMTDPQSIHDLIEQTQIGFVVEEVLDVSDDLVHYDYNHEKELVPKMWKDNAVLALAVGAIKELSEKVEALEARVAALEAK